MVDRRESGTPDAAPGWEWDGHNFRCIRCRTRAGDGHQPTCALHRHLLRAMQLWEAETGEAPPPSEASKSLTYTDGLRKGKERAAREVASVLNATEAVLRDDEVDLEDVTTPAKAKEAQLELVAHVRDQLADLLEHAEEEAERRPNEASTKMPNYAQATIDTVLGTETDEEGEERSGRCHSSITSRSDEHETYNCDLTEGHGGPHTNAKGAVWTDANTMLQPTADGRRGIDEARNAIEWHLAHCEGNGSHKTLCICTGKPDEATIDALELALDEIRRHRTSQAKREENRRLADAFDLGRRKGIEASIARVKLCSDTYSRSRGMSGKLDDVGFARVTTAKDICEALSELVSLPEGERTDA